MRANTRICAHSMRVFPFVIHSHDCVFYGIVLHNKKQNRRQFLQVGIFISLVLQVINNCLEWGNTLLLEFQFVMKFILMCETRTVLASELELCCFQQDMRHVNCCFDDFVTCSLIL